MAYRKTTHPSLLPAAEAAPPTTQLSRRSILRTAFGATAGAAAATLAAAVPAAAATGSPVLAGRQTLAEGATEVKYDGLAGFNSVLLMANDSMWSPAETTFSAALGGWAGSGDAGTKVGIYGYTDAGDGYGVVGVAAAMTGAAGGAGVCGRGHDAGMIGVLADSHLGVALKVVGAATFSRSGRASVPKKRAYVDVLVPGGIGAAANVLATIQMYRSGVWVAGVRRNYPVSGKARIYLNKVGSTTATTPVAWFVVG